jgi:hypothetical protein
MAGDFGPVSVKGWLLYRANSFLNTVVPLNLYLFHRNEPGLHSIYGPSPPVIPFFFQYWNTLPFGAGIAFFFCLLVIVYVAFRKEAPWLIYVFLLPLILFTIYMGWPTKGLLRDGLQVWFLGLMIFAVIVWRKYLSQSRRFWMFGSFALLFRGAETLSMLVLPSVWSQHVFFRLQFAAADFLALTVMGGGSVWLSVYTFRFARKLSLRTETHSRCG